MSRRSFLPILLFGLALCATQAQAQAQTQAQAQAGPGWLDRFNRAVAGANAALGEGVEALVAAIPLQNPFPPEWSMAGANFLANTVNEPISALSHAAMLDIDSAMTSLRRFGINVVQGYGGLVDRATEQGVVVARADPGLALCAWGVPPGPFVVLPLLGGRTLRDGLAEIALSSALLYPAFAPLLASLPGGGTVLSLPGVNDAATLLIARQIDTGAAEPTTADYDAMRAAYLTQRESRCAQAARR